MSASTTQGGHNSTITNPEQHSFRQRLIDVQRSFESVFVAHVEAEFHFFLDAVLENDRRRQRVAADLSVARGVDVVVQPVGGPVAAVVHAAVMSVERQFQTVAVDVVVDH